MLASRSFRSCTIGGALLVFAARPVSAIQVYTSDFIPNSFRTHFNGFESIPVDSAGVYMPPVLGPIAGPYTEDGITVQDVISFNLSRGPVISTTCAACFPAGYEGNRSWYRDGGGSEYTQITRSSGADFENIGFLVGSGGAVRYFLYELLDDGQSVKKGTLLAAGITYLGFAGGGFDTVRVSDSSDLFNVPTGFYGYNAAFALDSIELASQVPEPGTMGFLVLGLAVIGSRRFRRSGAGH